VPRLRIETPLWVLAVSLLFTIGATIALDNAVAARDASRFGNAVESTQDRIANRLDTYVAMLLATRGLFQASDEVTAAEFRGFVSQLELPRRYPGVQGIGFSRRLRPDEVPGLEQDMRAQGFEDFRVWPDQPRPELHSIVFLEPLDRRNRAAIGYDMFTDPTRREAMQRARDTGLPAASRRVTLVQEIDPEKQSGFLIYVPVVRGGELIGFVYSPFRAGDLFAGIFGSERLPRVGFEVFDGAMLPANLMHRSDAPDDRRPRFTRNAAIAVGGATWTLRFHSRAAFEAQSNRALVPLLLGFGVLLSAVLFIITRGLARARREAETQRQNLALLFTQTPAAVAVIRGPEKRYQLSNPRNVELSQGRALPGRTVAEALPELEPQITPLVDRVMQTGEPFVGTEVPVKLGDRQAYLNAIYQPLRDAAGRIEGIMAFAYEVTDLVVARQRVEAALRARDDFLSVAGHELRTPMTALALQLQGLQRQIEKGTLDPERLGERIGKALAHVARIERLVRELLDVSRITSGRLSLTREPVELAALVAEVVDRFGDEAAAAGCELRLGLAPGVVGSWDRSRLDQVLTNLMSNAIKYGAGQPVEIHAGREDERAFVTVRDRGIGIAPEDRERIFERFERAVSGASYGGLGLGLWISRQIVAALGGTVRVIESAPESGTTVRMELPLSSPSSPPIPA
jgi:signal transduction histidine kinase